MHNISELHDTCEVIVELQNVCKSWHKYKMAWNLHHTFLRGNMSSNRLHVIFSSLCIWLHFKSKTLFPDLYSKSMLEIREKLEWQDRACFIKFSLLHLSLPFSFSIFKVLAPTGVLAAPLSRWHAARLALLLLILLIISGHCYHHLCSSHWPLAGDAGLFCCSTCGLLAARALGSTGMLRSLPAPKPTPAGTGARTSPGTATTSLLWEWRDGKGGGDMGGKDMTEQGNEARGEILGKGGQAELPCYLKVILAYILCSLLSKGWDITHD